MESDRSVSELGSGQRMGKIGVGLIVKAAVCAAMIALLAGIAAAFFGS